MKFKYDPIWIKLDVSLYAIRDGSNYIWTIDELAKHKIEILGTNLIRALYGN